MDVEAAPNSGEEVRRGQRSKTGNDNYAMPLGGGCPQHGKHHSDVRSVDDK